MGSHRTSSPRSDSSLASVLPNMARGSVNRDQSLYSNYAPVEMGQRVLGAAPPPVEVGQRVLRVVPQFVAAGSQGVVLSAAVVEAWQMSLAAHHSCP